MIEVAGQRLPRHWIRIALIWLVLTAITTPLIVLVLGPHLPPGRMTAEAGAQTDANVLLTALLVPVVLLIWVFFGYAMIFFRQRGDTIEDGPPLKGHAPMQILWVALTAVVVLALAIWGSYTLMVSAHGAGGGQGPDPAALPKGHQHALQVQVIGQQWDWTFRYPAYGNFETRQLVLPNNVLIALHVTSLDVTHSFWAYQLGVKADAVPGVDNIAFVNTRDLGRFKIRCSELCGLFHGHMENTGEVVTHDSFKRWTAREAAAESASTKVLPPYGRVYFPAPVRRAG